MMMMWLVVIMMRDGLMMLGDEMECCGAGCGVVRDDHGHGRGRGHGRDGIGLHSAPKLAERSEQHRYWRKEGEKKEKRRRKQ